MEPSYVELENTSYVSQDTSSYCRVCGNGHEYYIQIYSDEGKNHGLADKINKHLPIVVSESDTLPIQLCYQCASTLLAFNDLIDVCLNAEKRFHCLYGYENYRIPLGTKLDERVDHREKNGAVNHKSQDSSTMNQKLCSSNDTSTAGETQNQVCTHEDNYEQRDCDHFEDSDEVEVEGVEDDGEDDFEDGSVIKKKRRKKDSISKCSICGKIFQFVEYLRTHLLSHSENRPHLCHICGATFKRKDHVNHHRKTVHMNHPDVLRELEERGECHLTCDLCGEVKPTKRMMVLHKKKHAICSRCDLCGESFNLPSLLKEHMVSLHTKILAPCSICGEEMKTGRELFLHKQKHFTSFICDVCGKSFAQQSSLRTHMVVHSDEKPYSCDECGKCFKLKVRLQLHKQSHTDNRPFACTLCKDKRFKTRTALLVHNNMHNDTRPYPCPHCSFRARKNSDLVCHIRTHTGEKPYKCEVCGRGFAQAGDMRKHRTTHERHKFECSKQQ